MRFFRDCILQFDSCEEALAKSDSYRETEREVFDVEFGERLRQKRIEERLTQVQLAKMVDVSLRTLQNYEAGLRRPSNMITVQKLANSLNTTTGYLLGAADALAMEAEEQGAARTDRDVRELVDEVSGLFVGGALSEEALDSAMRALSDAYWTARENNRGAGPGRDL